MTPILQGSRKFEVMQNGDGKYFCVPSIKILVTHFSQLQ